jgi:hypothetical protein
MRKLVYTAVFGRHDIVYPPIEVDNDTDYLIITDNQNVSVYGWKTLFVDTKRFRTPKAANMFYRTLAHRYIQGYNLSLYVDGNIRILSSVKPLFDELIGSQCAIMLHRHGDRSSVQEELCAVIEGRKVLSPVDAVSEVVNYFLDGFKDDVGLASTGVILKDHSKPQLDSAMQLWWSLFEKANTRDQLSLPYVIWKEKLDVCWIENDLRRESDYFAVFPHHYAKGVNSIYSILCARSHDSYWAVSALWVWTFLSTLKQALIKTISRPLK